MSQPQRKASRWCAVLSCRYNSNQQKGYSFFSFPKDKDRLALWLDNCGRTDLLQKDLTKISKSLFVCGQHFESYMFLNDLKNRLQPHAIPTMFAGASAKSNIGAEETVLLVRDKKGNEEKLPEDISEGTIEHTLLEEPPAKVRILSDISLNLPKEEAIAIRCAYIKTEEICVLYCAMYCKIYVL